MNIKLHLFPPFELKLNRISVNKANNKGPDTAINDHFKSPSNLSANKTYIF